MRWCGVPTGPLCQESLPPSWRTSLSRLGQDGAACATKGSTPVGTPPPPPLPLHGMAWLKDGLEHTSLHAREKGHHGHFSAEDGDASDSYERSQQGPVVVQRRRPASRMTCTVAISRV